MSQTTLCVSRAQTLAAKFRMEQGKLPTSNDPAIQLAYISVFPLAHVKVRGVVLFLHGIGEHYGRYLHLYENLCELGFGVVAYDLRSHGRSHMDVAGMNAHVFSFDEFVDDSNDVVSYAKREVLPRMGVSSDTPWIVMGMSLGSLIAVYTVLSHKHDFKGLVLIGPAIAAEMTVVLNLLSLIIAVLAALVPTARLVPAVNPDWISRDRDFHADFIADPLTSREQMTCRVAKESLRVMGALEHDKRVEAAGNFFTKMPILMLMGSEDKVTSFPMAQSFYNRIANKDKEFEVIKGAYHALLDDYDREAVLHKLDKWLSARFPSPPSARAS